MNIESQQSVICVMGPTGSGKTALAEKLASDLDGEIINADMGQFYAQLSIGTAKPDYKQTPFGQHLFDICDGPVDFDVKQYRAEVLKTIIDVQSRGKRVILVGGSLFYIKSLFYPPYDFEIPTIKKDFSGCSNEQLWAQLHDIDPQRAIEIHSNDRYRLERALSLYHSTGKNPSSCKPSFTMPFEPVFIWIEVSKETIEDRITQRMEIMILDGWIEEVERYNTEDWYEFYRRKGLIGYRAIADWILAGKNRNEIKELKDFLVRSTCLYAKRQKTFWKSFLLAISKEAFFDIRKHIRLLSLYDIADINSYMRLKDFLQ